jgi:hypothetical protein
MITAEEFFLLDLQRKIDLLYTEAAFIVAIRYYKYKVNLYLLHNFYVEVFYNHKKDNIEKIEPLRKNTKRMKFYADQISLPVGLLDDSQRNR